MQRTYLAPLAIIVAVLASYGGFLYSPITFDDIQFLSDEVISRFLMNHLDYPAPRQLAYLTLIASWKLFGPALLPLRLASLFLHAGVGISIYYFVRQLQRVVQQDKSEPGAVVPLLAGLIFVLHPVAVYGGAYLIQRTIVLATLFSIWSWSSFLHGLTTGKQRWLWVSVVCYVLAILGKEHAVMAPAVTFVLGCWWWRSQSQLPSAKELWPKMGPIFTSYLLIAILTALFQRGVLGSAYEFEHQQLSDTDVLPQPAWLLSVITQGYLFFKYLGLWLLPNPGWMSADMREVFAQSVDSFPHALGFLFFLIWPVVGGYLIWRGGRKGLLGFAMLAPWLLFATELITVRFVEIFVLYRSYLWLAPAFAIFAALDGLVKPRMVVVLLIIIPVCLFPWTWNRLMTFSHPFLLWNDAVRLAKDKKGIYGLQRIYVDRGVELHRLQKYDQAIHDYSEAIRIQPDFSPAYGGRASALAESGRLEQSLADFNKAIALQPDNAIYYANRAKALESMGRLQEAAESFQSACDIGWVLWCDKAAQLRQKVSTPTPAS